MHCSKLAITLAVTIVVGSAASRSDAQTLQILSRVGGVSGLTTDGSTLYGANEIGGRYEDGYIFGVPVTGGSPTVIATFGGGNSGVNPAGDLTLGGSTLYGMTTYGGANGPGYGTVYSVPVTGGTPTVLTSFDGNEFSHPVGGLTLSGSTLYGMTSLGVVFSLPTTGGTPTALAGVGGDPQGTLTLSGSTLYGMTTSGGADNQGSIFSVPVTGGSATTLASLDGTTTGAYPDGSLTLIGSTLYGMTQYGGAYNDGTIFSVPVTGGCVTVLASFTTGSGGGLNAGEWPVGSLTPNASGTTLYGATDLGGIYGDGTIFSIPVAGGPLTTLFNFNYAGLDNSGPSGDLTLIGSTLYGVGQDDGGGGALYALTLPEPSSMVLLGLGALGSGAMALCRRARNRATVVR